MKKQFLLFFSFCFLSLGLLAQTTVNMPSDDGGQKTVAVTNPITFYDAGGETGSIPEWRVTGITFEPRAGEVIEITFETIDLQGGSLIKIFDGKKALAEDYDWNWDETTYSIPSGHRVAYAGTKSNEKVRSLSSDGKLTVCFQNSNGSGSGWKATVKSIERPPVVPEEATGDVSMSLEPKIYIISQPTNFYDDGGKTGKISRNYDGKITFRPKTNGKKIKVTFNKLDLFNTSSTGKNDILKVYNGEETEASNLLATLLKDPTPVVIKSTAEDGSLTITLKSTTGIPKDGFEAVVEEFKSQPMTFNKITLAQITDGTVAAGDKNQAILSINVNTNDDLNPLNVSKLSFTTNSTFENIEKATLYYTKGNNHFATTTKVGEVTVTNDNFEINCDVPQELLEGNNYFWLTYDIKATAQNGQTIDAGCTAVTVSDSEKTVANPQPAGNKTIKNEYVSTIGTFEKTIYSNWTFTHTPNPYGSGYKAENGNQVVTFKPGEAGKVVQIDFADFDVKYSSSSYGTKAEFIIYNGAGISGEKLWEVDATNNSTGPNGTIRSTASDGSLTILFNAKTSSSYNNGKGWHATVSQYQSVPMNFVGLNVTQTNTEITKPNAINEEIIGFEIETAGDLSPLTLYEIQLNLKGSYNRIKKVSIFRSDDETFATTNLVGESVAPTANEVTMTLSTSINLSEGKNYFWVAYDLNDVLVSGQTVDAALTSVKIGTKIKTPANGDPDGVRVIKNIYDMQPGEHTINVSSSLMFYDNGGAENKYTRGDKETVTFIPKDGQVIKLDFKSFRTGYRDYFYIYNGRTESAPVITKLKGSNSPSPILSTAEDGSITISFTPTATYNNDGWEIEVSSYTPQPLTVASVKSTTITDEALLRGAKDEQMLKVEIEVVGDKGDLDFTTFDFSTENTTQTADISAVNLYFTDTLSTYSNAEKYAETMENTPLSFKGHTTTITKAGIYKFWLTYDINATATIGNTIEAKLTNVELANTAQEITENNIASRKLKAGFSGTYSVGTETSDYPTLTAAIKAMEKGIDGKVVFNIENGTYNELIKIPHVKGASSENTITIQSKSNNYEDVTFEVNRYSNPAYGEEKNGMFTVYGADYITIKGISFKTTAAFPSVINIKNISNHVTVDNCFIKAPISTSYSGIELIETEAGTEAYTNNNYFTIKNSILEGGRMGINIGGTGYVKLPKQKGAKIIGNTFHNQGAMSIYMQKEHDGIIDGNTFTIIGETAYHFKTIDAVMIGNTIIRNNKINISTSKKISGIYLRARDESETLKGRNRIYNNEIIITSTSTNSRDYVAGIEFTNAKIANTDIVYNSINILGAKIDEVATIYLSSNGTPLNNVIKNNILQNNAGKYVYYFLNNELLSGFTFANNALYTSGDKIAYAGNDIATFEDWKTASSATNSINEQAEFLSEKSLDLREKGNLLSAEWLDYVNQDIYGEARNTTTPTIGAYEYHEIKMPEFSANYPRVDNVTHNSAKAKVKFTENGRIYFLAKKSNETAPTQDEILAETPVDLVKNAEVKLNVKGLESLTEYKIYFVLQSLLDENSTVIASESFTTAYTPTATSTFEDVTVTSGEFTDATADFSGFVVENITDGQGPKNKKAAKITEEPAIVTINNYDKGLILNGFYFKSDAPVELTAKKSDLVVGTKSLKETAGKWVFINLKDMGEITSVAFSGAGNTYIDNFSGEPQPITFMLEDKAGNYGEEITIESDIYGGVLPYTYEWKNAAGEILSTETDLVFQPENTSKITLTVTDGWENSFSNSSLVTVIGKSAVATFDDLALEPESRWWGDNNSYSNYSTFYSGSYAFSNMLIEEWQTWGGFAYSNKTSTEFNSLEDQFNSAVGHGVNGSENYAVVYTLGAPTNVSVTHSIEGDSISGFYITNTAWVKDVSMNGTGMPSDDDPSGHKPFDKGDWYKITAEGDNGKSVDFYLADYRSDNTADHYTLDTWEWFDLRELGKVKKVSFKADGTRKNDEGSTIPFYFCMDNFGGERKFFNVSKNYLGKNETKNVFLPILFYKSHDESEDATITYNIAEISNDSVVTIEKQDKFFIIKGVTQGEVDVIISKTVKGKTVFAKLTFVVSIPSNLENTKDNVSYHIYPNPAVNYFNVDASGVLEIYNVNGSLMYRNDNYAANSNVDLSEFNEGVYIVKMNGKTLKMIKN